MNAEFIEKNTRKYIFDKKFPAESNPAGKIGLNRKEKQEICKKKIVNYMYYKLAKLLECHAFF